MTSQIAIKKLFLKSDLLSLFIKYQQNISDFYADRITKDELIDIDAEINKILKINPKDYEPTR